MNFLNPIMLLLLLLMPPIIVFLRFREQEYRKRLLLIEHNVLNPVSSRQRILRSVLWGASYSLCVIALARPVWGTQIEVVDIQGVSVMLVLDVSTSMDSQDILPSRLERAKMTLRELIQQLEGNEVGLVIFAGHAMVQFPLTMDSRSSADFLNGISSDSVSIQGTNIAGALRLALLSLNSASTGQHVMILLTDGESHDGDLVAVLDDIAQSETIVHTIGYGEAAGVAIPVRNPDGSIIDKTDVVGNRVISALDENTLRTIASATSGTYHHGGSLDNEASVLMRVMSQYTSPTFDRGIQSRPIERFDIFVAFAVISLALEIALSTRQRYAAEYG